MIVKWIEQDASEKQRAVLLPGMIGVLIHPAKFSPKTRIMPAFPAPSTICFSICSETKNLPSIITRQSIIPIEMYST